MGNSLTNLKNLTMPVDIQWNLLLIFTILCQNWRLFSAIILQKIFQLFNEFCDSLHPPPGYLVNFTFFTFPLKLKKFFVDSLTFLHILEFPWPLWKSLISHDAGNIVKKNPEDWLVSSTWVQTQHFPSINFQSKISLPLVNS